MWFLVCKTSVLLIIFLVQHPPTIGYVSPHPTARQAINDLPSRGELLRFCDSDSRACELFYRYVVLCITHRTACLVAYFPSCIASHHRRCTPHSAHQADVESAWWKQQAVLYKKAPAAGSSSSGAAAPGVQDVGGAGRFPSVDSTWEVCMSLWLGVGGG